MYWVDLINQFLIFALMALSLSLLLGYAGQLSVAHAALAAIGGYTAAFLSSQHGWSFATAVLVGMGIALAVGVMVSVPALLLSPEYLILLTLAVQTMIIVLLSSIGAFGGLYGMTGLPVASIFGRDLLSPTDWLPALLISVVVVFVLLTWIGESAFGRVLRGIREDQLATQALGKDVFLRKVAVFGATSAVAALGGAFYGFYNGIVAPQMFGFSTSILLVAMVVLGGRGNMLGALLGTALVVGSQPLFERVFALEPDRAALVRLIAFGVLLVLILAIRPQGLLPERVTPWSYVARNRRRRLTQVEPPSAEELASELATAAGVNDVAHSVTALKVDDIRKTFGGIKAVDGLSFELRQGRVTGLIGPNGAGKTTVFNLLTGAIVPDHGAVALFGSDITGWPIDRVAREGMVRSFQDVRVFAGLTVLENVQMAVPHQRGERLLDLLLMPWRVLRDDRRVRRQAFEALAFVGLANRAESKVSTLPFGEQKLVALARILAADAQVILLDEPASGIDAEWVERMGEIIVRLRDHGLTICVVEHNLHFVERVADHVYFMEAGRITAEGTMSELAADERLAEVYFGRQ